MCFTVSVDLSRKELEKRYKVSFPENVVFESSYFFSAFEHPRLPVITSEKPETVTLSQWGLIPYWTRSFQEALDIRNKTINARVETLHEKPSFRKAVARQHCLVPVTGFFEWHDLNGKKYPYYLFLKNEKSFAIAGLYDTWTNPETGEFYHSFTLITLPASPLLAQIHNTRKRMPAVLAPGKEKDWIKPFTENKNITDLLFFPGDKAFDYYPVNTKNAGKNPQDPLPVRPYDYGFDPLGKGLFRP